MKKNISQRKKILVLVTVLTLALTMILPIGTATTHQPKIVSRLPNEIYLVNDKNSGGGSFATHHMVLAEQGTATWCVYCPSASRNIALVTGDFQYVALVSDKNGVAASRCSELGISGIPDIHFDGGYRNVLGGQSSPANYQNAYNACQSRNVADVDITLFVIWDEQDSTMKITALVDNAEAVTYNGHLHVYVTEKTSRWLDYDGDPYTYAMLGGYALNQDITVGPGETFTGVRESWSYPDITMDNILVVAAVFDQSTMYTDETATANPTTGGGGGGGGNTPCPKLTISSPGNGETVNETIVISGTAHHPEGDGRLKWVIVKIDDDDWIEADGIVAWSFEWDTTQVGDGVHNISAVCSDGTRQSAIKTVFVNVKNNETEPEEKYPDLTCGGSLSWTDIRPKVAVSGEFTIENIGDPESELAWEITETPSWGDWTFNPVEGADLTPEDGVFTVGVIVVAPDENDQNFTGEIKIVNKDDSSDFEIISVSLATPKDKEIHRNPFFLKFLEQHPRMFPILRQLLGL